MELSEENLTQIIKDALAHYKAKEFGCAKYVQIENGFVVQFYDGPLDAPRRPKQDYDDDSPSSLLNPISVFNLPGSGIDFGGFGGGSSGGGGASGDW